MYPDCTINCYLYGIKVVPQAPSPVMVACLNRLGISHFGLCNLHFFPVLQIFLTVGDVIRGWFTRRFKCPKSTQHYNIITNIIKSMVSSFSSSHFHKAVNSRKKMSRVGYQMVLGCYMYISIYRSRYRP